MQNLQTKNNENNDKKLTLSVTIIDGILKNSRHRSGEENLDFVADKKGEQEKQKYLGYCKGIGKSVQTTREMYRGRKLRRSKGGIDRKGYKKCHSHVKSSAHFSDQAEPCA